MWVRYTWKTGECHEAVGQLTMGETPRPKNLEFPAISLFDHITGNFQNECKYAISEVKGFTLHEFVNSFMPFCPYNLGESNVPHPIEKRYISVWVILHSIS
jgi:hypothetical protein